MERLRELAERLRTMHHGPPILVLPNAWDVASASIIARSPGCRALATTSSGIAATLGYRDGEVISRDEMLEAVARIARAVDLPVTADLETGYGDPAATASAAIQAGAVGLNLEDGLLAPGTGLVELEVQLERVRAVRAAADGAAVPLVLNARTDSYLQGAGDFDETVRRGNEYLRAGADCVFVPGLADPELIGRLVAAIEGPLSVLAGPDTPVAAELERLGVARVSVGSGLMRVAAAATARVAAELLERGSFVGLGEAMPYPELAASTDA